MTPDFAAQALVAGSKAMHVSNETIDGGVLLLGIVGGAVWYCIKHQGRDWPTVVIGYLLALTVGAVSAGADLNASISDGMVSLVSGLVDALNGLG